MIVLFLLFVDPSQHKVGLDWDPTLGHAALGHERGSALKIENEECVILELIDSDFL